MAKDQFGFVADTEEPAVAEAGALDLGFVPDDVAAAAGEVAQGVTEEAPGWGDSALAFTQGLTRYMGGDFIREGGRRLVQAGAEALGADPEIAKEYNPFQTREEVLANKAASPTAATVGEVAGLVGAAVLPTPKLLPAGAINAAGAKAATTVAAKLAPTGSSVLRSTLAKAPALLARGAVEGAATAAFEEVNNAFLQGNYTKLAERIPQSVVTAAGTGALVSGAVGGAMKVGGLTLKGMAKLAGMGKVGADLVEEATREQARGIVSAASRELDASKAYQAALQNAELPIRTVEDFAAAADERVAQVMREGAEKEFSFAEKAAAAVEYDDVLKSARANVRKDMNVLKEVEELFDVEASRGVKQLLNRSEQAGFAIRDPFVSSLVQDIGQQADNMLGDGGAVIYSQGGGSAGLKQISSMSKAYSARVSKLLEAGDVGAAYNELDNFKSSIGRLQRNRDGAVRDFAEKNYERVRVMLEDPTLWGTEIAERQKIFNAALTRQISAESTGGLQGVFMDAGRKHALDTWRNAEVADDRVIGGLLSELGTGLESRESALRQYLGVMDSALNGRAQALGDPRLIEQAAKARDAVQRMVTELDRVKDSAVARNKFRDLESMGFDNIPGLGKFGKAAALASGRAHIAEREAARQGRKVLADKAAQDVITATEKLDTAAKRGRLWQGGGDLAEATGKTAGGLKAGFEGLDRVVERAADPVRRAAVLVSVDKAIERAEKEADPDSVEASELSNAHTAIQVGMGEEMGDAWLEQRSKRNQFLLEKAGPRPTPTVLNPKPKRVMDDETKEKLQRYIDAADDPEAALKRISDGVGTAEDTETLSALYPQMFDDFRGKVVKHVVESGKELSYDQALAVEEALGMPLNRDMEPDSVAFWQMMAGGSQQARAEQQAEQEQLAKAGRNASKYKGHGESYASKSQRVSSV
jgi:hypothetical protein